MFIAHARPLLHRSRSRAAALLAAAACMPPAAAAPAPAPAPRPAAAEEFPAYRAKPAPPVRMRYEMSKGWLSGSGDIVWKPAGDRYEARLEASLAGVPVLTEVSTGRLGAQGLAPLRYTDQRLRRPLQVANFERDAGRITYSGPPVEFPLPAAGAQDRLSWMLQIGAVLNAEPQHAVPGGRLAFFVTGARGDAESWTFRYAGAENVRFPGGPVRAVKFTREPRQSYDRLVEIWLAPDRHHLPVRARFSADRNGEVFELLLRDIREP